MNTNENAELKKGKQKQNRRWTASECLAAIYPKSARIKMIRLAVMSGLIRKMK